ncbi:serine-rich coiled-coil domain-containing protein 2 isoform X2 [Morone saxatilis]|uniref:serine-rich coiled-coil domain-containing protein 2 isoform X2 n=1 Tax=Morone saxatilis TaxID=34816 RepID=UPI0015E23C8E|nr:serine-rich coiled-coil domain-containing protein 2 isoform X2 [Morone saxatilis]
MEEKAPIRSAMVSRLPKFGGRSSTGGTSPLTNGSTQPTTPTQDGKTTPPGTRQNGVIRASPFSLRWKRDEGTTPSSPTTPTSPGDGGEDKAQTQFPSLTKELKSGSPATPKMRHPGSLMVAVSSPKAIPKQSLKMSPKVGTKQGQSQLNGGPKITHNGSSIPARTGSESRLVRPRLGSSSPRSSSQDSLSQSSDGLKTLALDNMVRSNSFTHFKQIPSPTSQPMTRSFSFNRAVELAKPLANTQLRPPRSSFLKPPQLSNGRVGLGLGSLNGSLGGSGGLQYSRTPPAASSLPTLSILPAPTTPSALRKPLLPSCVLTKSLGSSGGSLGYRLTRSGQAKQQKPLFTGRVKGDIRPPAAPECGELLGIAIETGPTGEADKADSHSDSDGSSGGRNEGGSGVPKQSSGQAEGETLEDMSLSSASSLDRGDTSEDFLDDIYSVGDVLSDGNLPDNRKTGSIAQTRLHSFLNETLDWDTLDLEGHEEESPMQDSQGPLVLSSEQCDALQASSVELSPSNSSGGTYMWDEDGLEPLGGPGTHPCDSYDDSELNSVDILNNLDPPGTGELDDDDLMLDVDLPEDGLHDSDRMSHIERSERAGRQGQRRKHHRWSGPDHFHNDSRAHVFQHYDGLKASRISSRPVLSEGRQQGYMAMLDELTLEHMTQDCSSLKNQLLRLKTLLQLEDTDSPADVPEEIEDNTTASQLGELIKEVQVLREELRSRDKTIAQLTLQCQQLQHQREQVPAQGRQFRCQCHHQRAPSSLRQNERQMDKRMQHHYDKATQTYWRPPSHAPQILQPFNPCLSEHLHQGRLVKTPPTEGHNDLTRSGLEEGTRIDADHPLENLTADVSGPADKLSRPLSTHLHHQGSGAPQGVNARVRPASAAQSAAQHEWKAPAVILQNSIPPRSAGSTCPRMLQPPRLHKRVSLPALKPGGTGGFASLKPGGSLGPLANRTKQLPPPTRGLPCFNTGPQVQARSLCRTSLFQPRRASEPCRDPRGTNCSLEEPNQGTFKDPGSAKILIPLSHSYLPKPKIP